MKHNYNVDVAVQVLFFNRPAQLQQVFDSIKAARPSKLFLYQDGPRNEHDMEKIEACRQIVSDENIDWECEVYRNYQEKNSGCDPSGYLSKKWAFEYVDKCILLEDDSVPSISFFSFCKELLDKYENDERITMIYGYNVEEISKNIPYDYFFTSMLSIWGWATWKRFVDTWDPNYTFLEDKYTLRQLKKLFKLRKYTLNDFKACKTHKESGIAFHETIEWSAKFLNSSLAIVPKYNMITNIGLSSENATHTFGEIKTLPQRVRRLYTMHKFEIKTPLTHPKYIIEDIDYKNTFYRAMCRKNPWVKTYRSLEELFLNLKYGNLKKIISSLINRIEIWCGSTKKYS